MTDFWRSWPLAASLGLLLGRGLPAQAQAQATAGAAAPDSAAWAAARSSYAAGVGGEAVLYDGPEYVDYITPNTVGDQFYLGPQVRLGRVDYRNGRFGAVPLRYDIDHDVLVLRLPNGVTDVALVSDEVAGFELAGQRFVRVASDSLLPAGFYEVLAEGGSLRLLARHRKQSVRATVSQRLVQNYQQTDELLLRTPTTVAGVSSLRKLVELLPDHQDEVLRYARQQRLSFGRAERPASAAQVLRYYYSLRP